MVRWLRAYPGLIRWFALIPGICLAGLLAFRFGPPLSWGVALIYGLGLALASRWPIVMLGTGAQVVFLAGLLLEAMRNHGLPTALAAALIDAGARSVTLPQGRSGGGWYQPLLAVGAVALSYGVAALFEPPPGVHGASWLELSALVMAYAYWVAMILGESALRGAGHSRRWTEVFIRTLQQTWWAPLTFIAVGWAADSTHLSPYPLHVPAALLLVWVQAQVGPIYTMLNQDRATAELLRSAPPLNPAEQAVSHRVLQLAHGLAQAMGLSAREVRVVGYAALLQDRYRPEGLALPRWLTGRPAPGQLEAIQQYIAEAVRQVERDGSLQEVAELIRHRYAAYDGQGYPAISGDAIPGGAQALAAANAIISLMEQRGLSREEAVAWLCTHAASRFSPEALRAMSAIVREPETGRRMESQLPGMVRQLRALVAGGERPSPFLVGLRRIWLQLRGNVPLAPALPSEVQAVADLAHLFASSTDAAHTAQIAVRAVGQLMGAKVALAVTEGRDDPLEMRFLAAHGFDQLDLAGRPVAILGGQSTRAVLNQAPVQVADLRELTSPIAHEVAQLEGIRSVLFVPMVGRGRTIGLMMVGMQGYHWFTPREVGLIHLMAGQAALALENARLIAEAEERLARISELKAFTDTLLDNLATGIIVIDAEGRLALANATARGLFGEELVGRTGNPLPQELQEAFRAAVALEGESVPASDIAWGEATLEVQAVPFRDAHGVTMGAICLARDVTGAREMEQHMRRVEKLAAVGELAAGAAHEIRNPLTSIRGFIQLLQVKARGSEQEYFKIVLSEIDRIDGIINDLLLLARPAETRRVATALPELIEELILLHQQEFERQSITVVREFSPEVGPVPVDPKSIRQLLYNLTKNAVQAMPFGGQLTYRLRKAGEEKVALDVADTGVGIPQEQMQRLFMPFFTTKEEGTGLGLALCHSIVEAHGGRIAVESRVGEGTTFTVYLPTR